MPSAASLIVALTLAAGGATAAGAHRRAARAALTHPPEGRLIALPDGRRVHAVTRGSGPDLVLIHGASGSSRDWTFRFVGMIEGRYRVTAFDRPGMGWSDQPRPGLDHPFCNEGASPAEQAAMLREAARLIGLQRPILLGHSYGASVALAWALDDPQGTAAVVDVAGATMPWPGRLGRLYRLNASRLGGLLLAPLLAAFVPPALVHRAIAATFAPDPVPPGYAAHFGPDLTLRLRSLRSNARQVASLRPHLVAMAARYPAITVPVEIVHGDADPTVPLEVHSRPLCRLIPTARLTVLPGIGHMPHHSAPAAVIAAIDRARDRAGLPTRIAPVPADPT